IREHLQAWIAHAHWAVAEEVYAALAEALPRLERRQAELAVVGFWVQQVTGEHQRLAAAGFTVPRQLDPTLAKALTRCYQLQAGLDADSPDLTQVRGVWNGIVAHYKSLEYYDVAQEAVNVKADEAVAAAEEYAAFQLVHLQDEHARRELARLLQQYGGSDQIALGPEFQVAIAGWKKFITDRPDSTLVPQATQAVFNVAGLFEQHTAHLVAAEVYADIAQFAAGIDVLSQSLPGRASTAERAAFARATALDAQARKMLAKQMADRKSDDPPPAKLSEEFAAAIAAYRSFIADHPESSLVSNATSKIMAVAGEYAKIDAWDVADGVFADLLASELDIRRPERLKFARGVCQLGRAMPGHAREVLATLTSTGLRGPGIATDPAMLAGMYRAAMPAGESRGSRSGEDAGPFTPPPPSRQPVAEPDPAPSPVVTGAINLVEKIPDLQANIDSLQTEQMRISGGTFAQPSDEANRDVQLLAMINQQEAQRALQVAQMRENITFYQSDVQQDGSQAGQGQQFSVQMPPAPVISEAELARQEKAIAAAYDIFQAIRKDHAETPTAEQARGEILVMVGHWRGLTQWQLSAELAQRFLDDNQTDRERPKLSLEAARDWLAWATKPIERKATRQEMLKRVSDRFDTARTKLAGVVADFPKEKSYQQQAQWDVAKSFLTQARVIAAFSPTLARGQYVRTARELRRVAEEHCDHPQISTIPQMLWEIAFELEGRGFDDEAIVVWNELTIHDPMHGLSQQAAMKIAQTYHQKLKRPLRAAQAYQELNFVRGGDDQSLQDAIFQIGSELKGQKRYVEALHVLETFVDSFPRHAQAGQALTMVGQIHQTNEAWEDAIAAYRRVIDEFENGQFRQDAKWAIAECTINLSQWREATEAYREYVEAYAQDAKVAEANRRIEVLKDLARYQGLVDQEGQRKAFDAQFQIATIVRDQLANPVKAIIEFRKVVANWPQSHLADDALYAVGTAYLTLDETDKAREALLEVAAKYPGSPLADDALYVVGKSHEDEATTLATVTRETTLARNKEVAQRRAYQLSRDNLFIQQEGRSKKIADLKEQGKGESAEFEEALKAGNFGQFNDANVRLFAQKAEQEVESLTATQLADRQDKINAALRKAVEAYTSASKVAGADKADESLLQMATIYDQQLKDSDAAMATWLEIVRQFSSASVAEDASWRIAQHYEREEKYAEAVKAYEAFLQSYRGGERAAQAQFAIAENYEHLGEWVKAMDAYTNYVTNYPSGPLVAKAKDQIVWIKTYWL
ncbi:MAG TPA: tetratricopeptide repeat protein, partial [Thermoguttaceae bacterium]|nr:tetratricopeptide repeat protein [Thermoguttaceae bacterium]